MTPRTTTAEQRDRLIRNVLAVAATRGLPVTIATQLDRPVRIRDRETDHPVWVRLRDLRADDVRCD